MSVVYYWEQFLYIFACMNIVQDIDYKFLTAIKENDYDAFGRLFRRYYEQLCRYAAALLGDQQQAEDIVQDVFIYLWEHGEALDVKISLKAYLYVAVRHRALKILQKRVIEQKHLSRLTEFVEYLLSADYTADEEKEIDRIKTIMQELPQQCLKVFLMSCLEEKKYTEIAEELDISVNTVKTHITKAYRMIRQRVRGNDLSLTLLLFAVCPDTRKI